MMLKKILSCLLALCLLIPASAALADIPSIQSEPDGVIVAEDGSCSFSVTASDGEEYVWRFVELDTGVVIPASRASHSFLGLEVSGENTAVLKLQNVPLELNGWGVFCRITNMYGHVDTLIAQIQVTYQVGGISAPAQTQTEQPANTNQLQVHVQATTNTSTADKSTVTVPVNDQGQPVVRAVNCSIQFVDNNNTPTGAKMTEIAVTNGLEIAVTASGKNVHSWLLNGVRYEFEDVVTRIFFRNVTEGFTIEPIIDGNPQTQKTAEQIQAARTGETLIVKSINAYMHLLNGKSTGGSSFREFDFTNDYLNEATGSREMGGQVSVKVQSKVPEGYEMYGWRFNDMRLTFNGEVKFFHVFGLDRSMEYEPLLSKIKKYSVTCVNCSFSGGGYSHATSGKVPAGTPITIHLPNWGGGTLSGDMNVGTWNNPAYGDYYYTVNHDCYFKYDPVIN